MKMKRKFIMQWRVLMLLVLTLAVPGFVSANHPFADAGTFDYVSGDQVVLADEVYVYSSATTVRSASGLTLIFSDLEIGDKVGYNFINTGGNTGFVTEIWKLSDSFDLDEFYQD